MPVPTTPSDRSPVEPGDLAIALSIYDAMRLYGPTCTQPDPKPHDHQTTQTLDVLQPMPLLPNRLVKRSAHAVMALKRIERLTVTKNESSRSRGRRSRYCVDVYCRDTHSRIPVHGQYAQAARLRRSSQSRENAEPSVTLEVGYDDFVQLRYDAYEFARLSHLDGSCCSFCRDVVVLNSTSERKPRWSAHLFKSDRETCDLLAAYLTDMLSLSVQVPSSGSDVCRGQERVPRLLQHFLRSHESDLRQSF